MLCAVASSRNHGKAADDHVARIRSNPSALIRGACRRLTGDLVWPFMAWVMRTRRLGRCFFAVLHGFTKTGEGDFAFGFSAVEGSLCGIDLRSPVRVTINFRARQPDNVTDFGKAVAVSIFPFDDCTHSG